MRIRLTNEFHETSAWVRKADTLSARTIHRVWRALCGMSDCRCSGDGGVRGGDWLIEQGPGGAGNLVPSRPLK